LPFFYPTMLMKDVFPAPFGPSIPKHWLFWRIGDNPRTANLSGFPSLPGQTFLRLWQMMV
jgi:hypothetical protein